MSASDMFLYRRFLLAAAHLEKGHKTVVCVCACVFSCSCALLYINTSNLFTVFLREPGLARPLGLLPPLVLEENVWG